MVNEKRTYCLQLGVYFSSNKKKQNELMSHLINCKPLLLNSDCSAFLCKCGKFKISVSVISSLIQKAASENQLFIRLD